MNRFDQCLKVGQIWESQLESWMEIYFRDRMPNWAVLDTRDIHRDINGDKFPDYVIYEKSTERYCFLDAKKRNVYRHRGHQTSFGFDRTFYHSYRNISDKHATKVFIAFKDSEFDRENLYILDLDCEPDFVWDYGRNGFGEPICYRWYVDKLHKFALR